MTRDGPAVNKRPASEIIRTRRNSVACTYNCVCVCVCACVLCVYGNSYLYHRTLFNIIMAPKRKSSDAGSASNPNRSRDVPSISEKVKIPGMIEIEKKNRTRKLPGCMARKNLPFVN